MHKLYPLNPNVRQVLRQANPSFARNTKIQFDPLVSLQNQQLRYHALSQLYL